MSRMEEAGVVKEDLGDDEAVGRPLVEDAGVVNGLGHPLFRDDVFVIRIQTASEQPSCVAS